jgi:hypothetical protein
MHADAMVDEVRKHLGLGKEEAEAFIKVDDGYMSC